MRYVHDRRNIVPTLQRINVTPLIDVLLVLLIIFMVIAPVLPHGLESSVPRPKSLSGAPLTPVVVRIAAAGPQHGLSYRLNGQETAPAAIEPALRSLFATRADRTLFIQADRALSYEAVAAIVGEGHRAGAGAVALQGQPKS